jgi:hypothetical protein
MRKSASQPDFRVKVVPTPMAEDPFLNLLRRIPAIPKAAEPTDKSTKKGRKRVGNLYPKP